MLPVSKITCCTCCKTFYSYQEIFDNIDLNLLEASNETFPICNTCLKVLQTRGNVELIAKCPNCLCTADTLKSIESKFGFRKVRGKTVVQSWCRECRKEAAADGKR